MVQLMPERQTKWLGSPNQAAPIEGAGPDELIALRLLESAFYPAYFSD